MVGFHFSKSIEHASTPVSSDKPSHPTKISHLRLKVQGTDESVQILEFTDTSETEAFRRVAARGLRVLAIESSTPLKFSKTWGMNQHFPLSLFNQELFALLDAGLNLTEALSTLHAKEKRPFTRTILDNILCFLKEGRNFSDVLAIHSTHFPELYVATIRASERTGDLLKALSRYITYQVQLQNIRKKLVSAAIYPAMLLLVGGAVTLFLLGYVVPRFSVVYDSSGSEMFFLSAALLSFGQLIHAHWNIALVGAIITAIVLGWAISLRSMRIWLLTQILQLPGLKEKTKIFHLARFYRAMSLLLASGIALPRAMEMVIGLLDTAQQKQFIQCKMAIEQGQSLSIALVEHELAGPVAASFIKVGERSGKMSEMLERTACFIDDDLSRWVDWTSRLFEPILMTFIGFIIGTIVVLMYLPIFELAGNLH